MNDFGQFGGSDEEFATVRVHLLEVVSLAKGVQPSGWPFYHSSSCFRADAWSAKPQDADPDSFEGWENLIKACEGLEGGLSRNSSPQALSAFRDAYDRFLEKYPLFFGYWKKYAELEFNIAGTESAEMVGTSTRNGAHQSAKPNVKGVRARMLMRHSLGRLVDGVLPLQNGHNARPHHRPRVSCWMVFPYP